VSTDSPSETRLQPPNARRTENSRTVPRADCSVEQSVALFSAVWRLPHCGVCCCLLLQLLLPPFAEVAPAAVEERASVSVTGVCCRKRYRFASSRSEAAACSSRLGVLQAAVCMAAARCYSSGSFKRLRLIATRRHESSDCFSPGDAHRPGTVTATV
jgi:hypothetical protein